MNSKYSCERCGKKFTQKSHYDSHKNRIKPCDNNVDKIKTIVDKEVKKALNNLNIQNLKNIISKNENPTMATIDTFNDLYEFLQSCPNENILDWLNDRWEGKDKQESLLRLFAGLGLIEKLNNYKICKGNFNLKTIQQMSSIKDIFYDNTHNLIKLKDKGDSSDLTGIHNKNEKDILVTTSKNLNKLNVGKLDIDKIVTNFQQYEKDGYTMRLCICIRDIDEFKIMKNSIEHSNKELKSLLDKENTIIIDWNDLNQAYNIFKMNFQNTHIETILNSNKKPICLKMHQQLGVLKTLKLKQSNEMKILWGHIQRSGKSYIIGGCIIEDSKNKEKCNYLVITTAPKETIDQQLNVFDCIQLQGFNIISLNSKNKIPHLTDKNIIVCSKQFLQSKIENDDDDNQKHIEEKTKSIKWLKDMNFEMRFLDESHNGGTTELAQKTLDYYGKTAFTIQITATYSKPINDYHISKENWILWDLEDIKLSKNITDKISIPRLIEKHGIEIQNIINKYTSQNIINEYSKYPELWLLTDELKSEVVTEIINHTKENSYGWSSEACFLLKQGLNTDVKNNKKNLVTNEEFQNETESLKMWYRIFGNKNKFGIPDKDFPDDVVFIKRIEKICKNPEINSRFIGDTIEPMIIMAFLPQNNIDKISNATIKLLQKYCVIPDYEIISINSKTTSNPKQTIEDARIKATNSGKKGVLVLSGRQCSLGVSIRNCDIVLLLNNNMGFDMIYQMMFRCMTEEEGKKCGFVVDLNINRVIETSIIDYSSLIKSESHPREATQYILQERLINLNGDHWMPCFGNDVSKITTLSNNVYNIYASNTETALKHFLNRLCFKEVLLTNDEQQIFTTMFSNNKPTSQKLEQIQKLLEDEEEAIKKGIEKNKVDLIQNEIFSEINEDNQEDKKEDKNMKYMDILKHIIPLICLLTIHNEETSFIEMFHLIENDKYIYDILLDQTKSWWGKNIDTIIIKKFINIYIKYMKNDKETNQIIRNVKELFMKNIKNSKELSTIIDKYLVPQELEKKSNAEVSTPYKLRQEMLDKIPINFWKSVKKVFEPCTGKGGFIIDIIDRFMIGLKDSISDEKERYRIIIEECLYFSDINPTNIFICKLLIDPYNEYKYNFNEGNTLELDIKEKWNINGFDAIIGNPPYQAVSENGTSKGGGNNLYTKFIYYADKNLLQNGYLLFINPPTYFGPGRSNNKNDMSLRKDILDKYYYHHINLEECAKHFNVGSKFIYYLIQKDKNNSNNDKLEIICKYNKNIYKTTLNQKLLVRDYIPYLLTNKCLDILDKIIHNTSHKLKIFHSPDNRSDKNHVLKKEKKETNEEYKKRAIKENFVYPMQATSVQIVYSSKKCKNQNDKKILMSRSGYLKPFYDDGIIGIGGDCFACLVSSKEEAYKIIDLLNSKLYKFYIETNKWSGFHNKEVLQDLPNIINDIEVINDNNINTYFNLSDKEIKLIEENV